MAIMPLLIDHHRDACHDVPVTLASHPEIFARIVSRALIGMF